MCIRDSDSSAAEFESILMPILDSNPATIELLWGDIQLGKRLQSYFIMWLSVHVLRRPVLYIFRNLRIDLKQMQDDLAHTREHDFNIKHVKAAFAAAADADDAADAASCYQIRVEDYKEFKLPDMRQIDAPGVLEKLSDPDAMNATDVFCCLGNSLQLDKINEKLNTYLAKYKTRLPITMLVDEGDLFAPSASNDGHCSAKDEADATRVEQCLSRLYQKVCYSLQITGTAHSLLSNVTTKLADEHGGEYIRAAPSRVHKMRRTDQYYGLFNDRIEFATDDIDEWWENGQKYSITADYTKNIRSIMRRIKDRPRRRYNSLLISEDKLRVNHRALTHQILADTEFRELFVIVFHGDCLKLYLPGRFVPRLSLIHI